MITATANNEKEKTARPRRRGPGKPVKPGPEQPPSGDPGDGSAGHRPGSTQACFQRAETVLGAPKGAPGIADIKKFFEEDGSRFQQLLEGLLERKPELLLYYLADKPVEHVEHSGGVIAGLSEDVLARARDYAQD